MASPINNFKNNLFGQLKSCSDVVQDVFQQRIARPLLAFKRDLNQSAPTTCTSHESKSVVWSEQTPSVIEQESVTTLSPPTETIDIEHTHLLLATVLTRVKNTLSPSTKRRTSEACAVDHIKKPPTECRRSSMSCLSNKNQHNKLLNVHKSVSFAEDDSDNKHQCLSNDQKQLVRTSQTFGRRSLMESINEVATNHSDSTQIISTIEDNDDNLDADDNLEFEHRFREAIRPRRMSVGNSEDLKYQDLSAEIVAYVLKTALKLLEQEDEELLLAQSQDVPNKNEQGKDFIDLK